MELLIQKEMMKAQQKWQEKMAKEQREWQEQESDKQHERLKQLEIWKMGAGASIGLITGIAVSIIASAM